MITLIEAIFGSKVGRVIAEIVLALALIGGAMLYLEHRGAEKVMAKLEKSSDEVKQQAAKQIATNNADHAAKVKTNEATTQAALDAAHKLGDALDDSVRQFDAYRRAHPAVARSASGPAAAEPGECGTRSCSDIIVFLGQRGDDLARSVAELTAILQGAQRERDSLTGLPK
jgi:preprotein translocase subunit SecD